MRFARSFDSICVTLGVVCAVIGSTAASAFPQNNPGDPTRIKMGRWRAVLKLPGGDLPFSFVLVDTGGVYSAYLINGKERVWIDDVRVGRDHITLFHSSFNSRITAVLENSTLKGSLTLVKRAGKHQVIPLWAWYGKEWRFFSERQETEVDVGGRWAVTFVDDEGDTTHAVGEFRQEVSRLYGTFLTPTGDYRYLEGDVREKSIYLSCFDGAHAFLFKGKVLWNDELAGEFWSGTSWHETWTAHRDDEVRLPDPTTLTSLKDGIHRLEFTFPDEYGTKVSLSDERFQNKVVIVVLAGTWCPNCHDEVAFLSDYYNATSHDSLEVVALMYEHLQDFEEASTQVKRFRARYNIQFPTLIAGSSDKEKAADTLPMLNGIRAFPTTIFIDRQGEVRRIYTGISGPGTGEHYEEYLQVFEETISRLLYE